MNDENGRVSNQAGDSVLQQHMTFSVPISNANIQLNFGQIQTNISMQNK